MLWGRDVFLPLTLAGLLASCAGSPPSRQPATDGDLVEAAVEAAAPGEAAQGVGAVADRTMGAGDSCKVTVRRLLAADKKLKADVARGVIRYQKWEDEALLKFGKVTNDKTRKLFEVVPANRWNDTLRNTIRERERNWLMKFNGHVMPVAAFDEAPIAFAWAKAAYGKASYGEVVKGKAAPNVELAFERGMGLLADFDPVTGDSAIMKDLHALVAQAKRYKLEMEDLVTDAADISMEIEVLKKITKDQNWPAEGYVVDIPKFKKPEDGSPGFYREAFMNWNQAKRRLADRQAELHDLRSGFRGQFEGEIFKPWTYRFKERAGTIRSRAYEQQAILLKLRTYYNLLRTQERQQFSKKMPKEYEKFAKSVQKMLSEDGKEWKADLQPPEWAKQKMRVAQISEESWAIFFKRLPKIRDNQSFQAISEFIGALRANKLTSDEVKDLGLNRVPINASLLRRLRPIQIVVAGIGSFQGLSMLSEYASSSETVGVIKNFTTSLFAEYITRNRCIQTEDWELFKVCGGEYILTRFPAKQLRAQGKMDTLFDGRTIKDPEIQAAVQALMKARRDWFGDTLTLAKDESKVKEGVGFAFEDDATSLEAKRMNLVSTLDDAWFKREISAPGGYMAARFPIAFQGKIRDAETGVEGTVQALIEQSITDLDARPVIYLTISKVTEGKDLANELRDLLEKHDTFLNDHANSEGARQRVKETILNAGGANVSPDSTGVETAPIGSEASSDNASVDQIPN